MKQISVIDDFRIVLENKPKIGLFHEICVGWSPDEFRKDVCRHVGGIALDFGHASCAARSLQRNVMEIVREFMSFEPRIFHISDNDGLSEQDQHYNLGKGSLALLPFLEILPMKALLTIETPRSASKGLDDFVDDVKFLRKLSTSGGGS
jgi:deoxyribonuclease-4